MVTADLKEILDSLYNTYDFKGRVLQDPIEFPHRYSNARDIEVSGLIASALAYGRVSLFKPVIEKILAPMGSSPADFILDFDPARDSDHFPGIKYRFNQSRDILCLIYVLSQALKKWGSIEKGFLAFYDGRSVSSAISGFTGYILSLDKSPIYGNAGNQTPNPSGPGFRQLFPSPTGGSSCKRINLFLRWMVRRKDIDFGIWRGLTPDNLVIPLDTHIARISRCLGLTTRKSQDWKMAEEITASLREFEPEDPLKYDFALCHQGIMGICSRNLCENTISTCPIVSTAYPR